MDEQLERLRRQHVEILVVREQTRSLVRATEARFGPLESDPATEAVFAEQKAKLDRIRGEEP